MYELISPFEGGCVALINESGFKYWKVLSMFPVMLPPPETDCPSALSDPDNTANATMHFFIQSYFPASFLISS